MTKSISQNPVGAAFFLLQSTTNPSMQRAARTKRTVGFANNPENMSEEVSGASTHLAMIVVRPMVGTELPVCLVQSTNFELAPVSQESHVDGPRVAGMEGSMVMPGRRAQYWRGAVPTWGSSCYSLCRGSVGDHLGCHGTGRAFYVIGFCMRAPWSQIPNTKPSG